MPIESNTTSDLGPNTTKRVSVIRDHKNHQTRTIGSETPREKMLRVVKAVQKKNKRAR